MKEIFLDETVAAISQAVSPGSDVMVHAALKQFGTFVPGVEIIIDALFSAVGPDGTIVMMSDTRSFAKTGRFDIAQPSETGLLTETFRKNQETSRSIVPMVSFLAKGARASEYLSTYHSYLDETSPLNSLLKNDGTILLFGAPYQKCTLWHLSEERNKVPDHVYKTFKGVFVDGERIIAPISQRYFVRRSLQVKKDTAIAGRMLEERSQVKTIPLGDSYIKSFKARDFDNCCMDALKNDPNAFSVFSAE